MGERVTGRKARGLQREEIACKCQTFLSLLSSRRKQTSDIFSFSIQIQKEVSLKILCCHNDTWYHLKLTVLKPRDNQCLFLMEMFVLSYANVPYIYPKLCLQVGSAFWLRTYLANQYVTLRYCSSNLCKWKYKSERGERKSWLKAQHSKKKKRKRRSWHPVPSLHGK